MRIRTSDLQIQRDDKRGGKFELDKEIEKVVFRLITNMG